MGIFGGGSNLPPGCRVSDIPGNRPEDEMWESIIENFWDKKRIKAMQRRGIIFLTHEQKTTMGRIWRRNAPRKYYAIQDSIDAYITVAITYGIELGNIGAEERQKENAHYEQMYREEHRIPYLRRYFKELRERASK